MSPTRATAHDHAYSVETLAEKADRLRREQAQQTALGDQDTPATTTPDTVPAGCYWWTDPDGDLCLMPGCMARVQDPAAECECDKIASRLAQAERELREIRQKQQYATRWWSALRAAVDAHPDGAAIVADTRRRTGR